MQIGIEAERANNEVKTGVEHYAKQLILHLAQIDPENSYILYLRTSPQAWLNQLPPNFKVKVMPFPIFWTQLRISFEMLFNPVDVLFIPASALPIIHPKHSVVTIHDVAWKYFPESFTGFARNFLEWSTGFAVRNAWHIIAVSESTKKDLEKFYSVEGKKIKVVPHGYEEINQPPAGRQQIMDLPEKFVLFLSTLQPRKNLETLIDAFRLLKKENPELPHKLVVAGAKGWKYEGILDKIEKNKDIVVYLGYVPEYNRFQVISKADLLALPSLYEGFGMTILEAFAQNVPVATSRVSSMPEVAGDAALYFDPNSAVEIKNAIKNVLLDKSLAENLKQKGRERLKQFSWEKTAQLTLSVLETK